MTTYQHILVPIDESPISYAAVEQALALAKSLNSQVTIMSVIAVDPFVGVDFYKVAPAITDYFMQAEKTAKERARGVDGVIVGSALVEVMLDESLSLSERIKKIALRAKTIKEKINS